MPRGGTPFTIEDMLIRKEETENRISNLLTHSWEVRQEIIEKIDQLEDYRHIEVLEQFFIENLTLDEIAEREHYSLRHTIRMYSEALRKLDIPIDDNKK
ncbi:MAG: hypothetical protein LBE23_13705 [Vagococcus sp.]|jgi:DNA-directed RNA polymerase specialized sigma subunit|nr:hypothetical protein [Vagococcus sp.]